MGGIKSLNQELDVSDIDSMIVELAEREEFLCILQAICAPWCGLTVVPVVW